MNRITEAVITLYPEATDWALSRVLAEEKGHELTAEDIVGALGGDTGRLRSACTEIFEYLWLLEKVLADIDAFVAATKGVVDMIDSGREWSAHGDSGMILSLLKSWYLAAHVEVLVRGFQKGTSNNLYCESNPDIYTSAIKFTRFVALDRYYSDPYALDQERVRPYVEADEEATTPPLCVGSAFADVASSSGTASSEDEPSATTVPTHVAKLTPEA